MVNRNKKLEAKKKKAQLRNTRQAEHRRNRPRVCGECRACCYVFPLIDKPKNVWCKHSTPKGCDCYGQRPSICSSYKCLYLLNKNVPAAWRPDRSGIIISFRGAFRGHAVLFLSQYWKNAITDAVGRQMLDTLLTTKAIIMYVIGDRVAVSYSHTGLVLDADGRTELHQLLIDDSERTLARISNEPFDFCGGERRRCCSSKREPKDERMADLKTLVPGQAT
jgi:hypothetical protein